MASSADFSGRSIHQAAVVLVTGGSSGIGRACVDRFIQLGATVVIADLKKPEGDLHAAVDFQTVDVTGEDSVKSLIEHIKAKYNRLDAVVNCAGVLLWTAPLYDFAKDKPHDLQLFNKIIQINLVGTFNVMRLAVGLMAKNQPGPDGQRGVIINLASGAAFDGPVNMPAYVASKAAVAGMTMSLSRELSAKGIRVVALAPGGVETPMLMEVPNAEKIREMVIEASTFPKRYIHADEIAHLIQHIFENRVINGNVIRIDAGYRFPFTS